MSNGKLLLLAQKYFERTITENESQELETLLKETKNKDVFKKMAENDYLLKTEGKEFDPQDSIQKVLEQLTNTSSTKVSWSRPLLKYAAAAIVIMGMLVGYQFLTTSNKSSTLSDSIAAKQIKLILEDGTEQIFTSATTDSIKGGNTTLAYVNSGRLNYVAQKEDAPLRYNTLKVPYGEHFQVNLSDGTFIDMNAGSSLRYPVSFLKNGTREVFLEGEAFFEVAKDSERRFIVNVNTLNIEVLGTRFNVSGYTEDTLVQTTLEEGSVKVYEESLVDSASFLKPTEQLSYNKVAKTSEKQIVKVEQFTAWRNDSLVFKDAPFSEIIKKLERRYDVKIINTNKQLTDQYFTARFYQEEISQIMTYFSKSYGFEFTINEKTITIK